VDSFPPLLLYSNYFLVIVTCIDFVRVVAPLVPTTLKVLVPTCAPLLTVTVSVLFAEPFAGGVTGLALNEQETFDGCPEQESVTGLLNPLIEVTVQVLVRLCPQGMLRDDGVQLIEKSPIGAAWVVKLNVVLKELFPQLLTARTRQKWVVL